MASDLPIFFAQQLDPEANHMAAFTSPDASDEQRFMAHWAEIMGAASITKKAIEFEGEVAGHVMSYPQAGELEVTYWIGRRFWHKGIATAALSAMLKHVKVRPLFARSVKDNAASLGVLRKCGFVVVGHDRAFAERRGKEVEEFLLKLT